MPAVLAALGLVLGCPAVKTDEEVKKEIQAVKAELQAVKEKLSEVQAGQKAILTALQHLQAMSQAAPPPAVAAPPQVGKPEEAPGVLTVSDLIKNKDRYLGQRVTVKGEPGPILVHKRIFHLRAPEGMVEVVFANLADKAQMERLISQVLPGELKVTGVLLQATGQGPSRLQINAETVEF
ncbi:MAG: hypothetical protein FJ128_03070 [Deltaproteobacteria bacterium]|nr:hypothetical protein [Deltaproteobacteria bacterium]